MQKSMQPSRNQYDHKERSELDISVYVVSLTLLFHFRSLFMFQLIGIWSDRAKGHL